MNEINSMLNIQQSLLNVLQDVFKNELFLTPTSEEKKPLNYFLQEVPTPTSEDEEEDPNIVNVPYAMVKATEGTFSDWNYTRDLNFIVVLCIYEPDEKRTGHKIIMNMIDQIFSYLAKNPECILGSNIKLPFEWTIQTDIETYPFYFGAVQINLESAGLNIEQNDLT